jgi:glycosyltransferase involved in cell wall biosynthesis
MASLSVVIITLNEERQIRCCIEGVLPIADEVIVVDSFSSDRTCAIAEALGARVVKHKFQGHIEQKNFARSLASKDLILSLDADEVPDTRLIESIARVKSGPDNTIGWTMNRLNFYRGKPIKTCGWYPDRKLRLWRRGIGEWTGVNPHDRYELPQDANISHLPGDILHDTHASKAALKAQAHKFAQIGARQLANEGMLYLLVKSLFAGFFRFFRAFVLKRGFLSGMAGWDISMAQAAEVQGKYFGALRLRLKIGA